MTNTINDPYGVPTGVVPRVVNSIPPATGYATVPHATGYLRVDTSMRIKGNPLPPLRPEDEAKLKQLQAKIRAGVELTALGPFDPIAKAVDDYIEMERKAKAWDALMLTYVKE